MRDWLADLGAFFALLTFLAAMGLLFIGASNA
jgi:hypothetical protein